MADGDLKKTGVQLVAEGQAEFQRAMQNARGQVAGFGDQGKTTSRSWVQSIGDIRASTVIAMAAVTGAVVAARKAYEATVGEAMDYAREIRQLSSITGQTAEETSRLVNVFGDFDIETSQVTAAMRIMRQQGLVPTMDTIAELSDRYLALAPGIERVNFLQTTFGRGGAEFDAVLRQGSAALRERAATVESGLVLTQRQLDQAEELRLAQDDLKDSIRSVSVAIGMWAIPSIASWTRELVRNITTTRDATSAADEFERRFGYMEAPTLAEADAMQRAWFETEHLGHEMSGTGATAAALWATLNEGRNAGENAAVALGAPVGPAQALRDALAGANLNLAGVIEQFRTNMAWITGGGPALAAAAQSIMTAQMGGKITPEQAAAMLQPLEAAALNLQTDIGAITLPDATRTMADDWGLSWDNARTQIQGAHDDILTLPAQVQSTIRVQVQWQIEQNRRGYQGFQHGGAFTVGGRGGTDRNLVQFAATRGERVIVMPPQTQALAPSYSDSHDQRTNNVSIQGQDLSNPFVVKRLFDQWLQGG
jgi:hypothetical protein